MPRDKGREPRLDVRHNTLKDGTLREYFGVRFYDAEGVCRRITCASRADAELVRAQMVVDSLAQRPGQADGSGTLGDFFPVWLADAKQRLEQVTVEAYCYWWRRRIEPRFGDMAMGEITPRAVAQWRASLAAEGVGPESIRKAMFLLQAILTIAIEWGEASTNPVRLVRKPKQGRQRAVEVIPPQTVEALRAAMRRDGDALSATLTTLLSYSGLRPAEALGLQRRHVREDTILVEQAVSQGRLKRQKTGRVYRTVDLLGPLREDLEWWFERQDITDRDALLFPRPHGDWWARDDWNNWRNRSFHQYTGQAGLGTPRPYDLRHSFVSLLIREQRSSVVEIADQLGHSPNESLKTYAHVMREHRRQEPIDAETLIREARVAAIATTRREAPECEATDLEPDRNTEAEAADLRNRRAREPRSCGAAELRSCGAGEPRRLGTGQLRSPGKPGRRGCRTAELRDCASDGMTSARSTTRGAVADHAPCAAPPKRRTSLTPLRRADDLRHTSASAGSGASTAARPSAAASSSVSSALLRFFPNRLDALRAIAAPRRATTSPTVPQKQAFRTQRYSHKLGTHRERCGMIRSNNSLVPSSSEHVTSWNKTPTQAPQPSERYSRWLIAD